jgi:hypothetical protein
MLIGLRTASRGLRDYHPTETRRQDEESLLAKLLVLEVCQQPVDASCSDRVPFQKPGSSPRSAAVGLHYSRKVLDLPECVFDSSTARTNRMAHTMRHGVQQSDLRTDQGSIPLICVEAPRMVCPPFTSGETGRCEVSVFFASYASVNLCTFVSTKGW